MQTDLNGNKAAVQEVTKSVNGLYAQKFIKLDVNGKIAGWGGANDGVESQFILTLILLQSETVVMALFHIHLFSVQPLLLTQ